MKKLAIASLIFSLANPFTSNFAQDKAVEVKSSKIGKIRMLSNNNVPKKVVVVRNYRTSAFVSGLADILNDINQKIAEPKVKLHVILSSSSAQSGFQSEMEKKGYWGSMVETNNKFYTSDQWMQDWGEIMVAEVEGEDKPQMTIFDSNRGRGLAGLPKILAKMWGAYYLKNPSGAGNKGDYGGNIEVTPDNILVLGDTSTRKLRNLMDDHGYKNKTAILPTSWLMVGHVDEYLSFIPNANAAGGYTIVKADPALAFNLIKDASTDELNQVNPTYRRQIMNIKNFLDNEGSFSKMRETEYDLTTTENILMSNTRSSTSPRVLNQLVDLNRSISKVIDQAIEDLKAKVREVTKGEHKEFSVVSFPTIFQGRKSGNTLNRCVALLPGTVNMLVVRDHTITPDAQLPLFNKNIKETMEAQGMKVHFLDDMPYHNYAGEIHCGTNIVRDPDKYHVRPDVISKMTMKRKLFKTLHTK
ncbi:protein-arginine deiminase domain-containing protein [bacterium]|nr:protein-arginine deiminase domain-containing protein [bacterium]